MEVSLVDFELPHCMYLPSLAYTLGGTYYFTNFRANFKHFANSSSTITNVNLLRILTWPWIKPCFLSNTFHQVGTILLLLIRASFECTQNKLKWLLGVYFLALLKRT